MSNKRIAIWLIIFILFLIGVATVFQKLGFGEGRIGSQISVDKMVFVTIPFKLDRDIIIDGKIEVLGQGVVGRVVLKEGTEVYFKEE